MRKLVLIVHISLDGFVAGINGELNGFENAEENLEFVAALTKEADTAVFGRKSFELLDRYWPTAKNHPGATKGEKDYSAWYNTATKIVFSRTLQDQNLNNVMIRRKIDAAEITGIKNQPGQKMLIFGSPSIAQEMMRHGLIDGYWIFINPVAFGNGIPLFAHADQFKKFRLISHKLFANGELALYYEPG